LLGFVGPKKIKKGLGIAVWVVRQPLSAFVRPKNLGPNTETSFAGKNLPVGWGNQG
jgi:hypothetical protein